MNSSREDLKSHKHTARGQSQVTFVPIQLPAKVRENGERLIRVAEQPVVVSTSEKSHRRTLSCEFPIDAGKAALGAPPYGNSKVHT